MAYTKYSLTPADNNAAPPNGAPEGMLPSAVNDTMRDMMAQIRDVGDGIRGGGGAGQSGQGAGRGPHQARGVNKLAHGSVSRGGAG